MGNWNHHEFYTIRLSSDWHPAILPESITSNGNYQYDSIQIQDKEELDHHLLVETCYGAGNSSLRHPVVLSELYRTAQADPQGCKVLLARETRNADSSGGKGRIIGSIILYHGSSKMNKYFPTEDRKTGGLVGIVAIRGAEGIPIVEGLISKSILVLIEMGFINAQTFIVRLTGHASHLFYPMHTDVELSLDRRSRVSPNIGKPRFPENIRISQYQQKSGITS